eukprot:TRINITY_DN13831_c0_g1_i2.p1 TRINITY_DN13831_c0_g1~~TRINITY_DN13831_c0_g1_i2.p1  ORF type:complete len:124 (+),score=8.68 TRINITY_DN13831_c0_g1_i2:127-498(+)
MCFEHLTETALANFAYYLVLMEDGGEVEGTFGRGFDVDGFIILEEYESVLGNLAAFLVKESATRPASYCMIFFQDLAESFKGIEIFGHFKEYSRVLRISILLYYELYGLQLAVTDFFPYILLS